MFLLLLERVLAVSEKNLVNAAHHIALHECKASFASDFDWTGPYSRHGRFRIERASTFRVDAFQASAKKVLCLPFHPRFDFELSAILELCCFHHGKPVNHE